jgi:hypothetical protein
VLLVALKGIIAVSQLVSHNPKDSTDGAFGHRVRVGCSADVVLNPQLDLDPRTSVLAKRLR